MPLDFFQFSQVSQLLLLLLLTVIVAVVVVVVVVVVLVVVVDLFHTKPVLTSQYEVVIYKCVSHIHTILGYL